jgi:transcriptional regulator with XRE-family HTH domain
MANPRRTKKRDPLRNDETVARNLRRYRIAAGMSQTELAGALGGITFQQVQKYENGTNAIAPGRLRKAAKVLGVTVAQLFEEQSGAARGVDFTPWSYKTMVALEALKSERVKRAVSSLIQELVGRQP